jgi:hypothetical protein
MQNKVSGKYLICCRLRLGDRGRVGFFVSELFEEEILVICFAGTESLVQLLETGTGGRARLVARHKPGMCHQTEARMGTQYSLIRFRWNRVRRVSVF